MTRLVQYRATLYVNTVIVTDAPLRFPDDSRSTRWQVTRVKWTRLFLLRTMSILWVVGDTLNIEKRIFGAFIAQETCPMADKYRPISAERNL